MARPLDMSEEDIKNEKYKKWFGGQAEHWNARGAFQLHLLKLLGLKPEHRLLDIGCGVIRGGEHIIPYLNTGNYFGVDNSIGFIKAARKVVRDRGLEGKEPGLAAVHGFEFGNIGTFDVALAFGVPGVVDCLENLPAVMKEGGVLYVTHARKLDLPVEFASPEDLEPGLDMVTWGWPDDQIFPIAKVAV